MYVANQSTPNWPMYNIQLGRHGIFVENLNQVVRIVEILHHVIKTASKYLTKANEI